MGNSRSTEALSIMIGSALMPGRDGKAQRRISSKEAYEIATKREQARCPHENGVANGGGVDSLGEWRAYECLDCGLVWVEHEPGVMEIC